MATTLTTGLIPVIVLLDTNDVCIGTLDYEPPDEVIIVDDGRVFEFEDHIGDEYIYRQVVR